MSKKKQKQKKIYKWTAGTTALLASSYGSLTEDDIREHADDEGIRDNKQAWDNIISRQKLSESFLREYSEKFNPLYIIYYQTVSKDFVREIMTDNEIFWRNLSSSRNINSTYFDEFRHEINWTCILDDRKELLTIDMIEKYFFDIIEHVTEEGAHPWEITTISQYPHLTEDFMRKHKEWLDWDFLSVHQDMSENFIEEFEDRMDWHNISQHQKMSLNFLLKHKNKVKVQELQKNKKVAPYIRKKFLRGIK